MKRVVGKLAVPRLCEGHAGLVVHFEDFLDGVHVGSCSEVKPKLYFMAVRMICLAERSIV